MTTTARSLCSQRRPSASPAARFAASPVYRGSLQSDPRPQCQTRGKKTRTVVRFEDLPQGIVLPAAPIGANERGTSASNVSNSNAGEDSQSSETPSSGPDTGGPAYPTVILQARRNMHKFANCVLLTRVGGFYELYFEHAQEYGPLLNIKVASKKTNAGPVPMAGFPFFQLDRFLKVLVHDLNRYVAIAEEFPNSAADKVKSGGLMHDRRVARIVTPGTLIDENFMDPYTNNYVMAIHVDAVDSVSASISADAGAGAPVNVRTGTSVRPYDGDATLSAPSAAQSPLSLLSQGTLTAAPLASASPSLSSVALGLAWLDLSTGHFYTQPTNLAALSSALSRVAPREIVLDERLQLLRRHGHSDSDSGSGSPVHPLFSIIDEDRTQQQQQLITYASAPPIAAEEAGSEASHDRSALLSEWKPVLESEISAQTAKDLTGDEISAGSLLLHYVKDRLQGLSMKLQPPVRYEGMQVMTIDKNSMRSLEIKQTVRDGFFRGSLLHAIRRTVTKSGARLLNEWLSAPSTSLDVIVARQTLVSRFVQDEDLRDGITQLLRRSHDSHRLVQKFALGRGDPDDLLDLAKTITATDDIVGLLRHAQRIHKDAVDEETEESLEAIAGRIQLERPLAIARRIRDSVDEEGLIHQHEMDENEADAMMSLAEEVVQAEGSLQEDGSVLRRKGKDAKAAAAAAAASEAALSGTKATATTRRNKNASIRDYYGEDNEAWVMKPSASKSLKMLHAQLADLTRDRETLTDELRTRLEAPSLVLKWTPGLGHICHVRGRDAKRGRPKKEEDGPTTISSSRTTRSLHVPEWTSLGQKLDQVRFHIRAEEQRVFHDLRAAVVRSLVPLRRNAAVLDELDIATSFARLALEQNLCRPCLHRGTSTAIVGGRHATVEGGLTEQGRTFTRNDLMLGDGAEGGASRIWLITGPNMAGKSTFLRQNALITILAQIGCYVPADYADLGLVDALFSRVGSADNLFRDQSTFMVEMLETAHILRQATPRSFVIMDEIGRGTTPEDGTAVAYAALHHLVHVNKCRGLFATHFHGLADLAAADGIAATAADANADANADTAMPCSFPVELYCTDVEEDGAGGFVYVHRLRKGINRQSHALKVARLAGLPDQAIQIAQRVLAKSGVPAQGS
ncbi:DNA mismatch repair protein Msh1 [Sporothrix schenckii 1099-18]|uniref:DNA mismatch repair protein n=1 Tax=Sporothrix schenckii 1099-18 TaxID=1397361 RepID=A0A0F2M124_SPOSC|nr:DNA mismatch repair protein Msh1 [Sporothrix schenckii 1099-18]KJR83412.1 DNA mismatch repair protein Msh1 [Sporothrix schenckii 1099-18]